MCLRIVLGAVLGSFDLSELREAVLTSIEIIVHVYVVISLDHISLLDVVNKSIIVIFERLDLGFTHFMQHIVRFARSRVQFQRIDDNQTLYALEQHILFPLDALLLLLEPVLRVPRRPNGEQRALVLVVQAVGAPLKNVIEMTVRLDVFANLNSI